MQGVPSRVPFRRAPEDSTALSPSTLRSGSPALRSIRREVRTRATTLRGWRASNYTSRTRQHREGLPNGGQSPSKPRCTAVRSGPTPGIPSLRSGGGIRTRVCRLMRPCWNHLQSTPLHRPRAGFLAPIRHRRPHPLQPGGAPQDRTGVVSLAAIGVCPV